MKNTIFFSLLALGLATAACAQKKDAYKADQKSVEASLKFLTTDELKGRMPGTPEMDLAAKYLEDIFVKNSIKPYFATYRDTL